MEKHITRNSWVDNLRSFVTILVVGHHAALAYNTFSWFNKKVYIASTHPVVDTVRCRALDIFVGFNDIFFMSLMFLISGLFMMRSLEQKPVMVFVRDRCFRLFVPFMIAVSIGMLLAYYPAFYLAYGKTDVKDYIVDFFTVEAWPVGPLWFIWVLFLFNLVFALCYPGVKARIYRAGALLAAQKQHPISILLIWYVISVMVYIPVTFLISPEAWTGIGPFDFQVSRLLLYFGYFLLGIVVGAPGSGKGIFADGTVFVKRWPVWCIACIVVFVAVICSEAWLTTAVKSGQLGALWGAVIYRCLWVLSCTLSCIALLTTFKSIFNKAIGWWQSLAANAYGIYLLHYIFVVWIQFLLLHCELPAVVKFFITFAVSVGLSWWCTYLMRKHALIRKYL